MKIAICNDTHAGARQESLHFNNYFFKFWDNVFFPYLKEHNITTVMHLGDLVDRRKFINYVIANSWRTKFFDRMKKEKINFILLTNESSNNIFSNCIGKLQSFKKDISSTATRNPFNKGKEKYDAYIYEFKYSLLPGCVFKKF
jgi:hypothetical protein